MSPQGYNNMDLESQDPMFNANLGQDELNLDQKHK